MLLDAVTTCTAKFWKGGDQAALDLQIKTLYFSAGKSNCYLAKKAAHSPIISLSITHDGLQHSHCMAVTPNTGTVSLPCGHISSS